MKMRGFGGFKRWVARAARSEKLRLGVVILTLLPMASACDSDRMPGEELAAGVSRALAAQRSATISDLRYEIILSIPEKSDKPITGTLTADFQLETPDRPILLDFTQPVESIQTVEANGQPARFEVRDEHVKINPASLREGKNEITFRFRAGDDSLNRTEEFLYTLFVPDRARVALPLFDQPDLKARFKLQLETSAEWVAVANGALEKRELKGERIRWSFVETMPISTYLFSFAAGRFDVEEAQRGERKMHMLHRETDAEKLVRNRDAIFDLHAVALEWLEEYTGIPYPFEKFDFVLIPSFQYRGMEHPGAILYRADSLLLDESATQDQYLARASLIAHETAHMWFGNLVTMKWFNDVWMKEVFANFMAAKIVHPSFPEIDHELRFLLAHYPSAYGVDRTEGANPIRQDLENLNEAGSLYGAIIYQKAPIVMKHLERLIGAENLKEGLRAYLGAHRYGNADWLDLIEILDARSEEDLADWSQAWVNEPRRPRITLTLRTADEKITSLRLAQEDPVEGRNLLWNQRFSIRLGYEKGGTRMLPVQLRAREMEVSDVAGLPRPDFILANGEALGYGLFTLDGPTRNYLLAHLPAIAEPRVRALAWLSLWDDMLEGAVSPEELIRAALTTLVTEEIELNAQRMLNDLSEIYWRFIPDPRRRELAGEVEALLWSRVETSSPASLKAAFFHAYRNVALSGEAVARLRRIWNEEEKVEGLTLSERDQTLLSLSLAVREVPDAETILDRQRARIDNPDRRLRFDFIRSAASADEKVRDQFFESLKDSSRREREPWVLDALRILHHPLRTGHSQRFVRPSLDLLEEIQRTGDIFFPQDWLQATLGGHDAPAVAEAVRRFLRERPDLPVRLRGKLLQAADPLFRAVQILEGGK